LVSRDLHQQQLNKASFNQLIGHLSPREHDVLHLLVEGKNSKEIASQLGISPKLSMCIVPMSWKKCESGRLCS